MKADDRKSKKMIANDQLSDLPDHLIHHIMSFLSAAETARFCVLSKRLSSAWISHPTLDLCSSFWPCRPDAFFDFARSSLHKRRCHLTDTQKLTLDFYLYKNDRFDFEPLLNTAAKLLDEISRFVVEKNTSELRLLCREDSESISVPLFSHHQIRRRFPHTIFSSRKLKSILLYGLNFATPDVVLNCPLLEKFHVAHCAGATTVEFPPAAKRVQRISIHGCKGLETIRFRGLESLHEFVFHGIWGKPKPCLLDLDLNSVKSLKLLDISTACITDEWFTDNISRMVSLERLVLNSCHSLKKLFVDNKTLKSFKLVNCRSISSIHVAVQGLESFKLNVIHSLSPNLLISEINIAGCTRLQTVKIIGKPVTLMWIEANLILLSYLKVLEFNTCDLKSSRSRSFKMLADDLKNVNLEFSLSGFHNSVSNFQKKFRDFIGLFGRCNTLVLSLQDSKEYEYVNGMEWRKLSNRPLHEVKHLKLNVCAETSQVRIMKLIDGFLCLALNLETMTFFHHWRTTEYVMLIIKFQYTLQGGLDLKCCTNSSVKCWRHGLTEVAIQNFVDYNPETLENYFVREANASVTFA